MAGIVNAAAGREARTSVAAGFASARPAWPESAARDVAALESAAVGEAGPVAAAEWAASAATVLSATAALESAAGGDGPACSSATTPRVMTRLATASTTTPVASAMVPTCTPCSPGTRAAARATALIAASRTAVP